MSLPIVYEWLELKDGEEKIITPLRWELDDDKIALRGQREGKTKDIKVLTIYVPKEEKEFGPAFWDLGQQTLIVQIWPLLPVVKNSKQRIKIKARGTGPSQRYSVSVV